MNQKTLRMALVMGLITTILFTSSCKKNSTGGDAILHVKIYNNGTPINHSNVYVKFDAKEAPSDPSSNYNLKEHGEETDNHVHIEGLRPGQYYLYAVGVNTLTGKTVKGGTAVEIKWKDRKKMTEINIEVAE